jgi:hypothetical protein
MDTTGSDALARPVKVLSWGGEECQSALRYQIQFSRSTDLATEGRAAVDTGDATMKIKLL